MARLFADVTPLRASAPFRRMWLGHGIANIGQQVTAVAVGLQVYAITQSSLAVGLVGLFQLVPLIAFGLYGGALSDMFDRRTVALLTSIGTWAVGAMLLVQSLAGWGSVPLLYALVAIHAGLFAIGNPARQSIIPRVVDPGLLPAANALSNITWSLAFTVGPLLAGVLVATTGTVTSAYLFDAVAYLAYMWAMWRLPHLPPLDVDGAAKRASRRLSGGWSKVIDGFRFLRGKHNLQMSFYLDVVAMVFGMPRALFPAIAALWFGGDVRQVALTVGLMSAAPAVGALLSGIFSGPLVHIRRHGMAVFVSVALWGATIAAFGFVRWLPLSLLLLVIAGAADNVSAIFRNTILQVATPDEYRGRLQGVFTVVVAGGPRAGDVESGAVASLFGEAASVISGGLLCIVGAVALVAAFPAFLRYDARDPVP